MKFRSPLGTAPIVRFITAPIYRGRFIRVCQLPRLAVTSFATIEAAFASLSFRLLPLFTSLRQAVLKADAVADHYRHFRSSLAIFMRHYSVFSNSIRCSPV